MASAARTERRETHTGASHAHTLPAFTRYKWDSAVNAGGIYQDFNGEIISKAHEALVSSGGIMAWQGLPMQPSFLCIVAPVPVCGGPGPLCLRVTLT